MWTNLSLSKNVICDTKILMCPCQGFMDVKWSLVQVMTWCRLRSKLLPEAPMTNIPSLSQNWHKENASNYFTRPQWVKRKWHVSDKYLFAIKNKTHALSTIISTRRSKMKGGKAACPSGIIADILKAVSEVGVVLARQRLSAVVRSIQTGRRASSWTSIITRMRLSIVAIIAVSSSQIKSWSYWDRCWTATSAWWWI